MSFFSSNDSRPFSVARSGRAECASAALPDEVRRELGRRLTELSRDVSHGRVPLFSTLSLVVAGGYLAQVRVDEVKRLVILFDVEPL